jgi:hypothetical protein
VGHLGIKVVRLLLIFVMNAAKFIADSSLAVSLGTVGNTKSEYLPQ